MVFWRLVGAVACPVALFPADRPQYSVYSAGVFARWCQVIAAWVGVLLAVVRGRRPAWSLLEKFELCLGFGFELVFEFDVLGESFEQLVGRAVEQLAVGYSRGLILIEYLLAGAVIGDELGESEAVPGDQLLDLVQVLFLVVSVQKEVKVGHFGGVVLHRRRLSLHLGISHGIRLCCPRPGCRLLGWGCAAARCGCSP